VPNHLSEWRKSRDIIASGRQLVTAQADPYRQLQNIFCLRLNDVGFSRRIAILWIYLIKDVVSY